MNEKEEDVIESAINWYQADITTTYDTSVVLEAAVKDLLESKPKEEPKKEGFRPPEKTLEQQLRCIELFGYPRNEYVLKGKQYTHKSVL